MHDYCGILIPAAMLLGYLVAVFDSYMSRLS